jgi:Ca2+-binding EF-hand superfamily protein
LSKQAIPAKPRLPFSGAAGSNVPPEIRARAFTRWDTNKDDILSLEEFQTALKGQADLEARFKNFDQNGDGKLTRVEFIGK